MRRKDVTKLMEEAAALLGDIKPGVVEEAEVGNGSELYLIDGEPLIARKDGVLFPTLIHPWLDKFPVVVVDMGAIPHICRGADVMAPGIVEIRGDFEKGGLVIVRDIRHMKSLAVGEALIPSEIISSTKKGKSVRNLHHVGDRLWSSYKL